MDATPAERALCRAAVDIGNRLRIADRLLTAEERDLVAALNTLAAASAPTPTGTVADIPDAQLLERAVRSSGRLLPRGVRWDHVMQTFALGSTYAGQLCRRFGLDPDEQVGLEEELEEEDEDLDEPVVGEYLLSEAAAAACAIGTTASQLLDERFVTVTKQGPDAWETESTWCIPDAGMVGAKVLSMPPVSAAGVPLLPLVGSVNADSVTIVLGNVETIDMGGKS